MAMINPKLYCVLKKDNIFFYFSPLYEKSVTDKTRAEKRLSGSTKKKRYEKNETKIKEVRGTGLYRKGGKRRTKREKRKRARSWWE